MRTFVVFLLAIVVVLVALLSGGVHLNWRDPCADLLIKARDQDRLAAVLPDTVINLALTATYGQLSSGKCAELLKRGRI